MGNFAGFAVLILARSVTMFVSCAICAHRQMPEPHGRTIHPRALAFNPINHRLYAVDQDGNRVIVVDSHGTVRRLPWDMRQIASSWTPP